MWMFFLLVFSSRRLKYYIDFHRVVGFCNDSFAAVALHIAHCSVSCVNKIGFGKCRILV